MFDIKFDLREFERAAKRMNAARDQVPFALSVALNQAATNARQVLVQSTWPRHVTVRNPGFISRALRTRFASKRDLRVEVYDDLGRAHLLTHAKGGTKRAKGRNLAIPIKGRVAYTQHGVRKSQRPKEIIAAKKAIAIGKNIFAFKRGGLELMYVLRPTARIKKDVPFLDDFEESMLNDFRRSFPIAMRKAMSTRR